MNFVMYGAFKKVSYNKVILAFSHLHRMVLLFSMEIKKVFTNNFKKMQWTESFQGRRLSHFLFS